jgi:outer membrane cobalamin receptor
MRNFISVLFFSITHIFLQAQVVVKGKVTDKQTGDELIGVTIFSDTKIGAITDVHGNYSLRLPEGKHHLEFRMMGYEASGHDEDLKAGDSLVLNIQLATNSKALETVVVSAGKFEQKLEDVTVSMEVISPKLVESKNTTSLDEIINQVPGVSVIDGQANIRGGSGYSYGGGSRVLLLVDDMPLLSADAGDVKWNYLPIENLQQIEILKGASSALFGSSALNGVINIHTAYPTSTPQTSIVMYSGIYDTPERSQLAWWGKHNPLFKGTYFFHSRQIKNWDLTIGGNLYDDDGYRFDNVEKRYRFNINTRYRFKRITGLSAGINVNYMDVTGGNFLLWQNGGSGALLPLGGASQHYDNVRYNIDPFITYFGRRGGKHSLRTRYFYTLNTNDTQQRSIGGLYFAEYQFQKHFENGLTLTTGATATYSQITSQLYGPHYSSNEAAYLQLDKQFFKKLNASIGIRGESYRLDTSQTKFYLKAGNDTLRKNPVPVQPVMRAGVSYQLAKATFIRTSFGQGYRFPSVAEKYISTSVSGLEIYPNPNLKPEEGYSAELGIKQGFQVAGFKGFLDVAGFDMQYRDMMEFTMGQWGTSSDPLFGIGFKSTNIGRTEISGVDVSLEGEGKIGKVGIRLLAGYTYMNPVSLQLDSASRAKNSSPENILKYHYRHIAKADLELSYKKFALGISVRYNSFMVNIDDFFVNPFFANVVPGIAAYRQQFPNGDIVFDNRISYQLNKVAKISLITNNMFNSETTDRPADVLPPRNYALQISIKF